MLYIVIFFGMAIAMLVRDSLWSLATALIGKDKWLRAACINASGEIVGYAMMYLTSYIVLYSQTHSHSIAIFQAAGQVVGGFAGILVGKVLSLVLDKNLDWYHARGIFTW